MSVVAEFTQERWESDGRWRSVEPYVSHVLLLWGGEEEEEPISEEDYTAILYGDAPSRSVPFRYYERDDSGRWVLDDVGTDHVIRRRFGRRAPLLETSI